MKLELALVCVAILGCGSTDEKIIYVERDSGVNQPAPRVEVRTEAGIGVEPKDSSIEAEAVKDASGLVDAEAGSSDVSDSSSEAPVDAKIVDAEPDKITVPLKDSGVDAAAKPDSGRQLPTCSVGDYMSMSGGDIGCQGCLLTFYKDMCPRCKVSTCWSYVQCLDKCLVFRADDLRNDCIVKCKRYDGAAAGEYTIMLLEYESSTQCVAECEQLLRR